MHPDPDDFELPPESGCNIRLHLDFMSYHRRLSPEECRQVGRAIDRFCHNPRHPSLHLELICRSKLANNYTIRANDEVRILVIGRGNTYVIYEAGRHDFITDKARSFRFGLNPVAGQISLIRIAGGSAAAEPESPPATAAEPPPEKSLLSHWTDAELIEAGMSPAAVPSLRQLFHEDDLWRAQIADHEKELAIDLMWQTPEQWRQPVLVDQGGSQERQFSEILEKHGAVWGLSRWFSPSELARLAEAPIEEWMIFLHPTQQAVVDRRYEGPARVRGAAGTGKTVVALHRAAALARRFAEAGEKRPILFTTYIRSLPEVLEELYLRLPGTEHGQVRFINIDRLAMDVCKQAGIRLAPSPAKVTEAFEAAYRRVLTPSVALARSGLSAAYLREEIVTVIRSRGLTDVWQYLSAERNGRRTRLTEGMRLQVWELHQAWSREQARLRAVDFTDVVNRALEVARGLTEPVFAAAIVDEAQDLTLNGLQLIRTLVNGPGTDRPDGLLLVGDGAQRIYPGGYTLAQAGISMRGRTAVLGVNYRNTQEILDAAMAAAGDEPVEDLEEELRRAEGAAETRRSGQVPRLHIDPDRRRQAETVVGVVKRLIEVEGVAAGDIAVLVSSRSRVEAQLASLAEAEVPALDLHSYRGVPSPEVKVGTYHRAKGLEFKVVLLPGLEAATFNHRSGPDLDEAEQEELRQRNVAALFVAMTRARDELHLFSAGPPCEPVARALARGTLEMIQA